MFMSSLFSSPGSGFKVESDIPSLDGKAVLMTGGTSGLGKETILQLSKHQPARIWLAARDIDKASAMVKELRQFTGKDTIISVLKVDLSSLETVRTAAETVRTSSSRLDLVILSAAVMAVDATQTVDGYELNFATNHLSHALLIQGLLPLLRRTQRMDPQADVRVVCLTSTAHRMAPPGGLRFDLLRSSAKNLSPLHRYAQSRLAIILYTRALARRYPELTFVSVHPAISETPLVGHIASSLSINSDLVRATSSLWMHDVREGIKNPLWATFAADVRSGEYYEPVGVRGRASRVACDDELERRLWDWTEDALSKWNSDCE